MLGARRPRGSTKRAGAFESARLHAVCYGAWEGADGLQRVGELPRTPPLEPGLLEGRRFRSVALWQYVAPCCLQVHARPSGAAARPIYGIVGSAVGSMTSTGPADARTRHHRASVAMPAITMPAPIVAMSLSEPPVDQ
jgi:hypothetical protein